MANRLAFSPPPTRRSEPQPEPVGLGATVPRGVTVVRDWPLRPSQRRPAGGTRTGPQATGRKFTCRTVTVPVPMTVKVRPVTWADPGPAQQWPAWCDGLVPGRGIRVRADGAGRAPSHCALGNDLSRGSAPN